MESGGGKASPALHGGAKGSRTPDLLNAIQALYHLSYDPKQQRLPNGRALQTPLRCDVVEIA